MAKKRRKAKSKDEVAEEKGFEIHENGHAMDDSVPEIPLEDSARQSELLAAMAWELIEIAHNRKSSVALACQYAVEYERLVEETAQNEIQHCH